MDLALPPPAACDWHIVVHLAVYPEWSRLSSRYYSLSKARPSAGKVLFSPRVLERPEDLWDVIQSLSLGIDILSGKLYHS